MAEITTTQAFSDGDTVTATKLNNITGNASLQTEAITNRSAETTVDQANDLLLMYDASATALKKVTLSNVIKAGTASNFPVTGNATIGGTLGVTGVLSAASTIELGHASDTTLARGAAGRLTVEGVNVPTISSTDTLTNKTLTSPVISSISNTGTLTLPTSTDTLVGRATTDTLTNKTLTSPVISQISNTGTLTLPTSTDTLVGRATTDTLTNKTLTSPVISQISNTGTLTLPTSTDTLVGRATTDTLTNKTLTSPVISGGTINNAAIGGTTPAAGAFTTLSATGNTTIGDASTDTLTVNATPTFATQANTIAGSASTPAISPTGDSNTGLFFPAADTIALSEGGAEVMRIDSSGNVGIGTTSPSTKLDVLCAPNAGVRVTDGTQVGIMYASGVGGIVAGTTSEHPYILYSNNSERLRIDSSGRVGIGTTSPSSVLSVHANNKTVPAISARYSDAGYKLGFGVYNTLGYPYIALNCNQVASSNNQTYDLAAHATKLDLSLDGQTPGFIFSTASSGTAGGTITWSERMIP